MRKIRNKIINNPYFSLIRSVWHYGAPWRVSIVIYYIAYIIAQACLGLSPYAFGKTIDVLQHFKPERLSEVILWLGVGVGVLLLFWVFHGPARVLERTVALKIQQRFRLNLYQQLTRLPLKWHQDHHSGNVITRLSRAYQALYRFASEQFSYIEAIIKLVVSLGFLFWISVPIGLLTLLTTVITTITVLLFDRKLIPLYRAENEIENHTGAVLFDYVNNMTTILTLRLGESTHQNLFKRMMAIWPFFKKDIVVNEIKWFTMMVFLSIVQSLILIGYIISALHSTGMVMIGLVVMIFRYQWDINLVFYELSSCYGEIVRMDTDVKSINPILEDIQEHAHIPIGVSSARHWHNISIQDLSFYHSTDEQRGHIFSDLSFSMKRGEKIALIGLSGGGKSTLLNLICGSYKASNVKLLIDSASFDSLQPLQAITTLIPQDPEIFENTIAFNITMDLQVEDSELNQVIKLAGFSDVLASLPHGLNTDIREKGLNLSVGQKQRLALARGLFAARSSSLILMDEPTSSVDLPTEKEILAGVIKAFPEAAMIVSLHRLHLLPQFDSIIMLKDGIIIARGPTRELLNTEGPVRSLWKSYQQED